MKIQELFTGDDKKSYFADGNIDTPIAEPLGRYSIPFASSSVEFREFPADKIYPMHTTPFPQYILFLEGSAKIKASGGEERMFYPGDIILARDTEGEGHECYSLEAGRAVIIALE